MDVDKVIFSSDQWIGFLGRGTRTDTDDQFLEIFSQRNLSCCLHTFKAEKGKRIYSVAARGLDTLAFGCEDGTVSVHKLTVNSHSDLHDSFRYDDVSGLTAVTS